MVTPQVPWKPFALASSGTVTNATVTSARLNNSLYKGCVLLVHRTAATGTVSMAVKLQGYFRPTDTWYDVANSDLVTYAAVGDLGVRYCMIYPGATGSDADGSVLQDTNFTLVNGFLPNEFRVSVTHGGTSVTNTFAVVIEPLL